MDFSARKNQLTQYSRNSEELETRARGEISAIAMTAYAAEIDYQQAIAVGFQLHIPKSVEPEELVRAIQSLNGK